MAICDGCDREVNTAPSSGNYKKVTGYVRLRKKGANEVALREDLDRYMHHECVAAIRAGISPGQLKFEVEPEIPGQMSIN